MPTPLTPDEEFDALFRRGLEHHPEQPHTPAAWHRMDLLLDADLRQRALRRKVLRMLGVESVLLVLLLWTTWFFVAGQLLPSATGGAVTARSGQSAGTGHELASAKLNHSKEADVANSGATSQQNNTLTATPPARPASATAATAQPAGESDAQPATTAKTPATNAAYDAATGRYSDSTTPLLAANAATHNRLNSRSNPTKAQAFSSTTSLATGNKKQPETTSTLVAAAATARRRGYPSPLAATRRPSERRALLPQQNWKSLPATAASFSAASAASEAGKNQLYATSRRARQRPATASSSILTESNGSPATAATRTGRQAGATDFGTAIDPLAPRWPTAARAATLPDSLRPVALAARPAPADSRPPRPLGRPYRLQLGLVAAPELSTVRAARLSPPGTNVGVQLDYRLTRRWRLSTAFLYTVKRYGAAGTDYTVPYTLPHGWVIDDVSAVCRIIDIPLNLRYDLWQRPRYQVFASAGLSSLLMKREQYTYDYAPVYGRPVPSYAFEVDNGSRHLLKVLNLSVGYERLLGPRWSVQAEPFVKLPLAGVGYGAVRLRSAGVFFSLRYGLLAGRPASLPSQR